MLGISRVAVFKKIKSGVIKAQKVGRNFIIPREELGDILSGTISPRQKQAIEKSVKQTVRDYGETLRLLGAE